MSGFTRCFIGNLPHSVTRDDLQDFLGEFRDHIELTIKDGYGFVEFTTEDMARNCIDKLNRTEFMGQVVSVEPARPRLTGRDQVISPSRQGTGHRVIVENLPDVTWQQLKDHFRAIGKVQFADVDFARREGIVEFTYPEDVRHCVRKMDRSNFMGKTIYIVDTTGSSGGRGRSRSRSPRRDERRRSRSPAYRRDRSRDRSPRRESRRRSRSPRREEPRREESRRYSRSRSPVPRREEYRR
ncbi:hypothetical protein H9P43_004796 [Blastocladiella emersonii ATCC 22665]|nr:hypothetical protein H9P43_004796 [Blastocladiella emersonii ATCC 22665]